MGVTAWSAVFAAMICAYGLKKLRKVQRVSMWGERGMGRRGTWRDVGGLGAPGEGGRERRGEKGSERGEFRAVEELEVPLPVVVKEKSPWEKEKEIYEKKKKG